MTLGEKIDRALDLAGLSSSELAEAIGTDAGRIRRLMQPKPKPSSVPLEYWYLMSKALEVPIEYWLPEDIDAEVTQTLLTVKAIRVQHEEQSDAVRAWEKHMDKERRKKWRSGK